jgi:predicted AlkP superfamily pyrophosphatase or phosphodiesterase
MIAMQSLRAALAATALTLSLAIAGSSRAEPAEPPRLMVLIVVDQFSASLFEEWRSRFTGGLHRLEQEGVVYPNTYQSHGFTETCPGHSTVQTGMRPEHTGIVANGWRDRVSGQAVNCTFDPAMTLAHDPAAKGAGPANLMATTLGDWLKAVSPASKVVGVAGKDRSAIMPTGHQADAVFWATRGGFTTNVAPGQDAAERLAPIRAVNAAIAARRADPANVTRYSDPACQAREATYDIGGTPWRAVVPPKGMESPATDEGFIVSPMFDESILQVAETAAAAYDLGGDDTVDILTVGLSGTDVIGHMFGSRGPEMCEQMRRLDAALGPFLHAMEKRSHGRLLVALTADHGGSDMPERLKARGFSEARRLDDDAWRARLNAGLRADLGLDFAPVASGAIDNLFLVGADGKALAEPLRTRVLAAALTRLGADSDVAEAYSDADLAAGPRAPRGALPDELTVRERLARSRYPGRSGDILVAFKPAVTTFAAKTGQALAGHGSPWDYDRRVPLIFWRPGATGEERILPVETVDIAPTLAPLIGVTAPAGLDGRDLGLAR